MRRWLHPSWLLALAVLAFRLPLLSAIRFVNPDAATFLDFGLLIRTQRLPFYPMLVGFAQMLGFAGVEAGKMVAVFSAAVAAGVLCLAAEETGIERRFAWLAGLALAVDPLFAATSLQALSDPTFAACAAFALFFTLRAAAGTRPLPVFGAVLAAGLAALTRAEGLVFAPVSLWLMWRLARRGRPADSVLASAGLFPWGLMSVWQFWVVRRAGYFGEFAASLAADRIAVVAGRAAAHLLGVGAHLLGVGLLLALVGWGAMALAARTEAKARTALRLLGCLTVATLGGLAAHWYFDLRLSASLALWQCVPFAWGVRFSMRLGVTPRRLALVGLGAMTAAGLVASLLLVDQMRDIGADLREAAQHVRGVDPRLPLVADELSMASYHAGRQAWPYDRRALPRRACVMLSDRYSDLRSELVFLEDAYEVREAKRLVRRSREGVHWTVVWIISRRGGTPATSPSAAAAPAPGD